MTTFRRAVLRAALGCSAACLAAGAALAQDAAPTTQDLMRDGAPARGPAGYLDAPLDGLALLAPPPADGSARAEAELQIFHDTRALEGSARWALAAEDAEGDPAHILGAFNCAAGVEITPDSAPATAALIGRAMIDAGGIIGSAKSHFARPRPVLVAEGPTCVPVSEGFAASGSYPSGHSTVGWMYALILAELMPDRAAEIMARGRAYGESRVVCGVHYPSDVEAGRLTATAVFAALQSDADFAADREVAAAELATLRPSTSAPDSASCAASDEASRQTPW